MLNQKSEKLITSLLSIGMPVTAIFLLSGVSTDPVNSTKFLSLGVFSTAILFALFHRSIWKALFLNKVLLTLTLLFIIFIFISTIFSNAPVSQLLYGLYGRNTGFLTYSFLTIILISASILRSEVSFLRLVQGFLAAGTLNLVYCAWVISFGDFIGWNNPYQNILGLFGNPDFISAFLGIYCSVLFSFIFSNTLSTRMRIINGVLLPIGLFEIWKSGATQGALVFLAGVVVVGFFAIHSRFKLPALVSYSGLAVFVFAVVLLGTLQQGPLSFLHKRSVALRGSYWQAGIEMGQEHPFTGIGLDSYGDWYRRARPPKALIDTPGAETLSNVAHNVVIDLFASGGWPVVITYSLLHGLALISIVRIFRKEKSLTSTGRALILIWVGYQVQSVVSINQIGLAIWGWLSSGAIIGYAYRFNFRDGVIKGSYKKEYIVSPNMFAGVGLVVGCLISVPPLSADSKWFIATKSRSVSQVESALKPSYMNPQDSYRYQQAVNLFSQSNLPELALKYAKLSLKYNPDYFEAWRQLYYLPNVSTSEKNLALENMKRLDPLNPTPEKLPE